jgi:hypothetical protein
VSGGPEGPDAAPEVPDVPIPESAGLCARCMQARPIVNDRGSLFVLCEASRTDPSLERYPRLPVLRCHGFTARRPEA